MSSFWKRRSVSLYLYLNTILITSYLDNMKKVLYSFMLVLGMSLMFCSCEKEEGGGKVDETKIEGKWWAVQKFEALFNGKVVKTYPNLDEAEWEINRFYIENGNITLEYIDGNREVYACSIIDGKVTIWGITLDIVKSNSRELVCDMQWGVGSFSSWILSDYNVSRGKVISSFNGKDIYSFDGDNYKPFWYYDDKGKPVACNYHERTRKEDNNYPYYYVYDYWSDFERYYFKAE